MSPNECSRFSLSIFVLVFVFVEAFFFHNIQLDWIESYNFKFCSTLFTIHYFALVRVQINMDISIAFRASSGRHSFFLPALSERQGYIPVRESTTTL